MPDPLQSSPVARTDVLASPRLGAQLRAAVIVASFAAALYLGLVLWAGWGDVLAALRRVGAGIFAGLLGLSLINFGLRSLRWHAYLGHLGYRLPFVTNLRIYLAGFALTVTPGKVGEMLRGALLAPLGVPYATSAALFFVERLSDLLAVLILASLVFGQHPLAAPLMWGTWCAVALALLAAHQTWLIERLRLSCKQRGGRAAGAVAQLCTTLLEFRRCFEFRPMLLGLFSGLLAWGAQGVAFYWLLQTLGLAINLDQALFAYALGLIAGVVSFLPGGLGGSEAAMIALLTWYGATPDLAVSATIVMQFAALWFAVLIGVTALMACRRTAYVL